MNFVDHGLHLNPQQILPAYRACMFCYQMNLTGEHAKACPGAASDIRTWGESTTDADGYPRDPARTV